MALEEIFNFLNKFLEDMSLFVGPVIPLFFTFSDVSSGFPSQSGKPYSPLARSMCLHIP